MYINGLHVILKSIEVFGVLGRYRWRFVHVTYLVFPLATFTMAPRYALFVQRHAIFLNLHSIGKKFVKIGQKIRKLHFLLKTSETNVAKFYDHDSHSC